MKTSSTKILISIKDIQQVLRNSDKSHWNQTNYGAASNPCNPRFYQDWLESRNHGAASSHCLVLYASSSSHQWNETLIRTARNLRFDSDVLLVSVSVSVLVSVSAFLWPGEASEPIPNDIARRVIKDDTMLNGACSLEF